MAEETPTHIVPFETNPFKIMVNGLNRLFNTNSNTAVMTIVVYYVLNIASYAIGLTVASNTSEDAARQAVLNLGVGGIGFFLGLMGLLLALRSLKGEKISSKGLFQLALSKFLPFVGYSIVLGFIYVLAFVIGFISLFIPFVLAIVWLGYTMYVKLDQELPFGQSMKESKALVKGRGIEFFAVMLIAGIVGGFGGPALQAAILGEEYMQLKVLKAANPAEKPPISKACWWLLLGMLVIIGLFIALMVALIAASANLSAQ